MEAEEAQKAGTLGFMAQLALLSRGGRLARSVALDTTVDAMVGLHEHQAKPGKCGSLGAP